MRSVSPVYRGSSDQSTPPRALKPFSATISCPLDGPRLVALEEVLGWDASLAPLVGLERGHWAEREALSEDWRIRTDPLGRRG